MGELSDYEAILSGCAAFKAQTRGTRVSWVDTNGTHVDLKQYPFAKISVNARNLQYQIPTPVEKPSFEYSEWFDNDTSLEQASEFTKSVETTDSFSYSFTKSLKISYTAKLGIQIPFISFGGEWTTELDFSSTQTTAQTRTIKWEKKMPIKVPPKKSLRATLVINEDRYDTPWSADIVIGGNVAMWFKDKIDFNDINGKNFHWLWFPSPDWILCRDTDIKPYGMSIRDLLKNYTSEGRNVIFKAQGVFTGVAGVNSYIRLEEFPLRPADKRATKDYMPEAAPLKSHIIEVQHG